MLEFAIVATGDRFRFRPDIVTAAARAAWPEATVTPAGTDFAGLVEVFVDLPGGPGPRPQLAVMVGGESLGLDAPTRQDAASVIAWLCQAGGLPDDGSVIVIHWSDAPVVLRPGMTQDELLRIE